MTTADTGGSQPGSPTGMGGPGPGEGSTTRMTSAGTGRSATEPRVDAGVNELNEMTIGRTDDPENPFGAQAFRSRASVWDWIAEPIWASGHEPRQQAGHMIAVDPPVRFLILALASKGPSTHAPTPRTGALWSRRPRIAVARFYENGLRSPDNLRPLVIFQSYLRSIATPSQRDVSERIFLAGVSRFVDILARSKILPWNIVAAQRRCQHGEPPTRRPGQRNLTEGSAAMSRTPVNHFTPTTRELQVADG